MSQEKYQAWLDRLDVPVEDTVTLDRFQTYLEDELLMSDEQINALSGAFVTDIDFEDVGIHAVTVEYPWGRELRYGITGQPGLWGFQSAMNFYQRRVEEETE